MKEIILNIKTNKVGSAVKASTGYSVDEWMEMTDEEKAEVTSEIVWDNIDVWESEE